VHREFTNNSIKIIKAVLFTFCGTGSAKLREWHRLRLPENRVMWEIFGSKQKEMVRTMEKTVQWSFLICALYHALLKG